MRIRILLAGLFFGLTGTAVWSAPVTAPDMPDLTLPTEEEIIQTATAKPAEKRAARQPAQTSSKKARKPAPKNDDVIAVTNATIAGRKDEYVEEIKPDLSKLPDLPSLPSDEELAAMMNDAIDTANTDFVPARDTAVSNAKKASLKIAYKPNTTRDPTLSPDDTLLLKHQQEEKKRLALLEQKRKIEAERRRRAEAERRRQLELERLRDPSREIRGRIRVNGIIGQEVFIGDKVYTVGKTVLGARIVSVQPDRVVFTYKGQKFTKKIQLQ